MAQIVYTDRKDGSLSQKFASERPSSSDHRALCDAVMVFIWPVSFPVFVYKATDTQLSLSLDKELPICMQECVCVSLCMHVYIV